jgi:hypothetical protein
MVGAKGVEELCEIQNLDNLSLSSSSIYCEDFNYNY